MEVRELHLYSEKIEEEDVKNLFNRVVRAKFPLFGFLSFSDIFSPNALSFVVKRNNNTFKFYLKEKERLQIISPLIFPYRLCETAIVKASSGSLFPVPKMYSIDGAKHNLLDFLLKESIEEFTLDITKVAGGFIGNGIVIDERGRKGFATVWSPEKFLKINMEQNPSIYIELLEPLPKKMYTNSSFPVFEDTGMSLGVDNYDPLQHTLIAGTSGSGKSKALYVLLRAVEAKYRDSVRTIIIDPHGEFAKLMPNAKVVNFVENYVEPLDVGKGKTPMLTQLISQLITSTIGQENKYSERVLFYTVHLLSSIDKLELNNISKLLTDSAIKAEFVSMCDNQEVKRFFDEEYNDIYIHHFNNAILPILNFIGEYQLYLGKEKKREDLLNLLENNNLTIISFDPKFFGRRMISFLAGAIINQMYILAITGKLESKKTILVVDEFPRVETRITRDILSETRKFGLFTYLSCQYLGQLSKEVLDSVVSNTRNIIAFKINKQDAAMLSSIMEIKMEEYFKKHRSVTELEESKKDMFVRLHQRECIVRLYDGSRYLLPMKVKIVDAKKWELTEERKFKFPKQEEKIKAEMEIIEADKKEEKPGVPLQYRNTEAQESADVQNKEEQNMTEGNSTEVKPTAFSNPMAEEVWLQETPEAIYQLEKAKIAATERKLNTASKTKGKDKQKKKKK